ncbi:allantoicase [Allokutzneria sp. A3M-2-11 16]|uniref:allantoicase n=1 Tax=Allokutzneria sp. A3M-2-11 16 TaxID=2962043 RepID=UPI0020B7E96B|nr:allantoicase [Allokutzneria sp. A3M-2-11 16]MCP3801548.1 allantoicase [Allokutzneria sp. A3M-2-11 16]
MTDQPDLPDLAARSLGGSVIAANDEFFAEKENLIKSEPPTFRPHTFTPKGQEYDGWETRRRRGEPGSDWVIVRLGAPGVIRSVVVDTAFFVGNFPESCTVEATAIEGYPAPGELDRHTWVELVPRSPLQGGTANTFQVSDPQRFTHVRLTIHPDGGVARLRVLGEPLPDPRELVDMPLDLVALLNGGRTTACSDSFFSPPNNMLQPGESKFMSDGWETARRRGEGNDWAVLRLAGAAVPKVAELSTLHYKGNPPHAITLSGSEDGISWFPLLERTEVQPDTRHRFRLTGNAPVTHVRLDIHPDGGVARFRLWGKLTEDAGTGLALSWFNLLPAEHAVAVLTGDCGLTEAAAAEVVAARPVAELPEELALILR